MTVDSRNMDAILERIQKDISNLSNAFKQMQIRMDKVEKKIDIQSTIGTNDASTDQTSFSHRLADSLDSIIGLRECVHSSRKIVQKVWAILLLLGCIATVLVIYKATAEFLESPIATKVQVEGKLLYQFPTMMICPDQWFDSNEIEQFGISKESLQYALYFIQKDNLYSIPNITKAKNEFLDYYSMQNFSSLPEYFSHIAIDLKMYHDRAQFEASDSGVFGAKTEIEYAGNGFLWHGMCFSYNLLPVDPSDIHSSVDIHGKMLDKAKADYFLRNWWMLYFDADFNFFQPIVPGLYLKPGDQTNVQIYVRKYVSMDQPNAPCLDDEKVDSNYSPYSCFDRCQNDLYQETINCRIFANSFANETRHPTEYCNHFEMVNGTKVKLSEWKKLPEAEQMNAKALEMCTKRCPRKCVRTIYEAAIQWTKPLSDDPDAKNLSRFKISIRHNAMFDGGIWTLTEMSILSPTDWVTNIGGSLGLFVGGSIMTFVQLIMFILEYVVEKLGNRERNVMEIKT